MILKISKTIFILIVCGIFLALTSLDRAYAQYPGPTTPAAGVQSPSPTSMFRTSTPTRPNQSLTPSQITTPSQTYTPSVIPSSSPTTTLMPLPAITLVYPISTSTMTVTSTPEPLLTTNTQEVSRTSGFSNISPRLKALTIVLVILWLILAGFLVVYIRQFR